MLICISGKIQVFVMEPAEAPWEPLPTQQRPKAPITHGSTATTVGTKLCASARSAPLA